MPLRSLRSASLALVLFLLAACGEDAVAPPMADNSGSVLAEAEATAAAIRAQTAQSAGGAEGEQAGSGSASLPAGSAETTSAGGPKRSDGFWEITSFSEDGSPMGSQSLCVGAGSEDKFSIWDQILILDDCSRKDLTRNGVVWAFDTHCEWMEMVHAAKGTISGDFRTEFRVDQTVNSDGRTMTGSIRGENKGPCPAPFKSGDLVSSDGSVLANMLE